MLRHCVPGIALALLMYIRAIAADTGGNPSGSLVNIINALSDSFVLHCSSKDNDFGQTAVYPKTSYYWKFDPNIFGRTAYNWEFLWANKRQEFPVWEGNYYDDRPNCCRRGPCSYKVALDGIYITSCSETDDQNLAEAWDLYKKWLPNPIPLEFITSPPASERACSDFDSKI